MQGIHDVFVDAVGAGRICIVAVNVFGEEVAKQSAGFSEAFSCIYDNGAIVVNEDSTISGDVDWFNCGFPGSVRFACAIPVRDFADSVQFVAEWDVI